MTNNTLDMIAANLQKHSATVFIVPSPGPAKAKALSGESHNDTHAA